MGMKYKPEEWVNHPDIEMADWDDMHVGFDDANGDVVGLDGSVIAYKSRADAEIAGGRAFSARDVSPSARKKLKGILDHYRKMAHPFTTCVRDQVKHGLTKDHAERRCAVIKDLALGTTKWRGDKKFEDADVDDIPEASDDQLDTWLAENPDVHDGLLGLERFDFEEARAAALREYRFNPNQPRDREGKWTDSGAGLKYGDIVRTPKGEAVVRAVDGDNVLVDHPDRGNLRFKAEQLTFDRSSTDTSTAETAIDKVIAMNVGDKFKLRGKTYTVYGPEGTSHYGPHSGKGERSTFPVWNEQGKKIFVTVRPGDKIEPVTGSPGTYR